MLIFNLTVPGKKETNRIRALDIAGKIMDQGGNQHLELPKAAGIWALVSPELFLLP